MIVYRINIPIEFLRSTPLITHSNSYQALEPVPTLALPGVAGRSRQSDKVSSRGNHGGSSKARRPESKAHKKKYHISTDSSTT